mgnify:CR=1 FL=1
MMFEYDEHHRKRHQMRICRNWIDVMLLMDQKNQVVLLLKTKIKNEQKTHKNFFVSKII